MYDLQLPSQPYLLYKINATIRKIGSTVTDSLPLTQQPRVRSAAKRTGANPETREIWSTTDI
jgi:hypothetical protein